MLKQKQRQSVHVVVNVAHPKLRRKTKRRVRAAPKKGISSLQSSYQQPLTRAIRYDVPAAVAYPVPNASPVGQPSTDVKKDLIIDNPLLGAIESKIATANKHVAEPVKMTEDAPFGYKKDGSPYKRKPKGFVDLRYEPDIEEATTQPLFEKVTKKKG